MTSQGFRFLHASDFRLDAPVDGLIESPDRLGDALLEAPRVAAERVFSAALKEKVDFVVLTGDLLSPRDTGPRGLLFLIDQFARLEAERIPIYWAAGRSDSPDVIPSAFRFPENVHIFPVGSIEEVFYNREGAPLARILGTSWGKTAVAPRGIVDPVEGADDLYTIGAYNGRLPAEALKDVGVRYWALGGSRLRETVSRNPNFAVYAGSTLARNFTETGDFGATLVEVGESGRTTATLLRTSPLRWSTETIVIREDETEEEALAEARSRVKAIQEKEREEAAFAGRSTDGDVRLVSFRVEADQAVLPALRYGATTQTIVRDLRTDFTKTYPIVYVVDFEPILTDNTPEEMYERQTILGDYLRMVRYYRENPKERIDIEQFMPEEMRDWGARERIKNEIATRRAAEGETADLGELATRLAALDAKQYSPETGALYELTTFDASPSGDLLDAVGLRASDKESQRRAALLEAAALGADLLAENDSPVALLEGGVAKGLTKKNRVVAAELRSMQKNLDGKEIGS
ncbi:MAG: hypothetical protein IJU03_09310 [Thermoguttaceae bacterium]|nr:hypothetical protein [Thermoguttaceae bacterium]